ncbi:Signal peptidase I [Pandoravirus neocaledonia]|uniref:Signal peptidase I n=1 Tax=Pandoravirus neocaledonia TaxID=2107708 RepID=A0A2U7UCX3_9VIRU|nr:Signal peptidase I [Pandoravirus neocaledonia]AVK76286.1 Signal peptidase I [Pandoravirus neocaledonia]
MIAQTHARSATQRGKAGRRNIAPEAPVARTLSAGATIFWAIYPVLWTCLVCFAISRFLGCTVPVAAVTSGSMEPQTYRGDLLLLVGPDFGGPVRVGDIVLYRLPHRPETPIVHRVVDIVAGSAYPPGQPNGDTRWYLTKGDDNGVDDTGLVAPSFPSGLLPHAALIGKVRGQMPLAGYPALLPVGVKIAAAIICASRGLHSLLAGAKKADDVNESPVAAWRWALLVLCPLV